MNFQQKSVPKKPSILSKFHAPAFLASLVAHAVIFLVLGSVIIFEAKIPPNLFTGEVVGFDEGMEVEAPPLLEESDPMQPEPDTSMPAMEAQSRSEMASMDTSDLIVSSISSSVPSLPINFGTPNATRLPQVGSMSGNTRGKGGPGKSM